MDTLVFILKVGDDFFEVIFTQRCEYLFLVLSADHDMTISSGLYFINFSIEFIKRIFYYIGCLNIFITTHHPNPIP